MYFNCSQGDCFKIGFFFLMRLGVEIWIIKCLSFVELGDKTRVFLLIICYIQHTWIELVEERCRTLIILTCITLVKMWEMFSMGDHPWDNSCYLVGGDSWSIVFRYCFEALWKYTLKDKMNLLGILRCTNTICMWTLNECHWCYTKCNIHM